MTGFFYSETMNINIAYGMSMNFQNKIMKK